jgi:hypothetical protein
MHPASLRPRDHDFKRKVCRLIFCLPKRIQKEVRLPVTAGFGNSAKLATELQKFSLQIAKAMNARIQSHS